MYVCIIYIYVCMYVCLSIYGYVYVYVILVAGTAVCPLRSCCIQSGVSAIVDHRI